MSGLPDNMATRWSIEIDDPDRQITAGRLDWANGAASAAAAGLGGVIASTGHAFRADRTRFLQWVIDVPSGASYDDVTTSAAALVEAVFDAPDSDPVEVYNAFRVRRVGSVAKTPIEKSNDDPPWMDQYGFATRWELEGLCELIPSGKPADIPPRLVTAMVEVLNYERRRLSYTLWQARLMAEVAGLYRHDLLRPGMALAGWIETTTVEELRTEYTLTCSEDGDRSALAAALYTLGPGPDLAARIALALWWLQVPPLFPGESPPGLDEVIAAKARVLPSDQRPAGKLPALAEAESFRQVGFRIVDSDV